MWGKDKEKRIKVKGNNYEMQIIIEKTFANKHKSVCGRKIRRETIEMARYVAYGKSEENKKNRWKHAIGGICQRLPTKYEIKTSK